MTGQVPDAAPKTGPSPKTLTTRFIRPFFFGRRSVPEAQQSLQGSTLAGFASPWTPLGRPGLYTDELLDHVATHLFGTGGGQSQCGYLRLDQKPGNRIFRDLSVNLRGRQVPVALDWTAGVEVFLSPRGVGVLSIAFALDAKALDADSAIDFNYLIARTHASQHVRFRVAHRSDDDAKWATLKEEQKRGIPPAPALDAPFEKRLGAAGGEFTMDELTKALLAPLSELRLRSVQQGFSLYTVALFGDEIDLEDEACRGKVGPLLSALVQVEEPNHAGGLSTIPNVPNAVLNRRHWAAVGQLACAHAVADQPLLADGTERGFNAERVQRVRDKYFVPWLVALLERLSLQRALDDACEIVGRTDASSSGDAARAFSALRSDLLEFSVGGNFTQVSTRHAIHTFFKLCRAGFDISDLWTEVRHAIFDIDSRYAEEERARMAVVQAELAERQAQMSKAMAESLALQAEMSGGMAKSLVRQTEMSSAMSESLATSVRLQEAVHVIEVFLVTVYSAHFMLMLVETCQWWFAADEHSLHRFHLASPFLVFGAALAGFIVTLRFVRRGKREH